MNVKVLCTLFILGCCVTPLSSLTPMPSRLPSVGIGQDNTDYWNRTTTTSTRAYREDRDKDRDRIRQRNINNFYYPYYTTYPSSSYYSYPYYSYPYGTYNPYAPHEAFPDAAAADDLFEGLSK